MSTKRGIRVLAPVLDLSSGTLASQARLLREFSSRVRAGGDANNTILGIDVGTRYVGLAVSDSGGKFAFPLRGYRRTNVQGDIRQLCDAVSETSARAAVVGVPVLTPLRQHHSRIVRDFIFNFATRVVPLSGVTVVALCDENYSSCFAREGVRESVPSRIWDARRLRKHAIDAVCNLHHEPSFLCFFYGISITPTSHAPLEWSLTVINVCSMFHNFRVPPL